MTVPVPLLAAETTSLVVGVIGTATVAAFAYLGIRAQTRAEIAKAKVEAEIARARAEDAKIDAQHGRDTAQQVKGVADANTRRIDELAKETGKVDTLYEQNRDLVARMLEVTESSSALLDRVGGQLAESSRALAECERGRAAQTVETTRLREAASSLVHRVRVLETHLSQLMPGIVAPPDADGG